MGYSFDEIGMTRADILAALDAMPDQDVSPSSWSGKVYLMDPRDGMLWDLKPAVRIAGALSGKDLYPQFTSDRYRRDLGKLGFAYVIFDKDRKRHLGLSGFDPEELADPHTVFHPDGHETENNAETLLNPSEPAQSQQAPLGYERKIAKYHLRWERRGVSTRRIKETKGLVCEGCDLDAEAAFGRDKAMACMDAHHLRPMAQMPPQERAVSPDDFAVLCATCHRLIHTLKRPDDLKGLRRLRKR